MEFSEFREGWRIVLAAFFVNFLTDGFLYQFGLFLVELLDEFGSSRAATALIGSIATGIYNGFGPISGSLADIFGSGRLVIAGTLISFAGFVSAAFAETIQAMYITFGLLGGIGFGLLWVPANACVMKHFTKSRGLASGMAVCGTGFGTFAISKLMSYLITEYGWRMALFIMAGIVLNGIPCGLLFGRKETETISITNKSTTQDIHCEERFRLGQKANSVQIDQTNPENRHRNTNRKEQVNALQKTESTQNEITQQENESKFTNRINSMISIFKSSSQGARNIIKDYRQLLKNNNCVCFVISTFFFGLAFPVPFSILPDHAEQKEISISDATWLVSSIGMSTTIGRILFGWLGDRFSMYRRIMFETMIIVQGITLAAIPLMTTFKTKLILTCSFGLAYGCYFTPLSVILADEFGQDKIGKTLGLNCFALGLSTLAAAPLAGGLYDISNNYSMSFYVAGGSFCLASLWLIVPRKMCAFKGRQQSSSSLPHTNFI